MTYPATPGFQSHSRTSQAAAESINVSSMEGRVENCLARTGTYGMTADEIQQDLIIFWPHVQAGTVGARLRGLELKGVAVKVEETRTTRAGKQAHVWVLKGNDAGRHLAPTKESESPRTAYEIQLLRERATLELRLDCALITIESQRKELEKLRGAQC